MSLRKLDTRYEDNVDADHVDVLEDAKSEPQVLRRNIVGRTRNNTTQGTDNYKNYKKNSESLTARFGASKTESVISSYSNLATQVQVQTPIKKQSFINLTSRKSRKKRRRKRCKQSESKNEMQIPLTFCGSPVNSRCYANVPTQDRLSVKRKTSVDKLRLLFKIPDEAVPKNSLPAWKDLPLNFKLPLVPAPSGRILFSRGGVAKPLLRTTKKFTLEDPLGLERVPTTEYNALHDTHAENYFNKPLTKKILMEQNLITCNDQVICTQKEFNQFRAYLATIQNDKLNDTICDAHQKWLIDREQMLKLLKFQSLESAKGQDYNRCLKTKNAQRKYRLAQAAKLKTLKERRNKEELRLRSLEVDKQRQILDRRIWAEEKEQMNAERRKKRLEWEAECRTRLMAQISLKDVANKNRIEQEKREHQQTYENFLLEWLEAKYKCQEQQKSKEAAIERDLDSNIRQGAIERQERLEMYRQSLPEILKEQKKRKQKLWAIVRKYFYRWLNKMRERKQRKPDSLHQSLWDVITVLDDTMKHLRLESGYEKFDSLVVNILKLKGDIKAKLVQKEEESISSTKSSLEVSGEQKEPLNWNQPVTNV